MPQESVQDFAKRIKEKYPNYANLDDLELSRRIVSKYPQYKDKVNLPPVTGEDISKIAHQFGLTITSGKRSSQEQKKLIKEGKTKATNSFHLFGQAFDVKGDRVGEFRDYVKKLYGYDLSELLDEKNHTHVAWQKGASQTPQSVTKDSEQDTNVDTKALKFLQSLQGDKLPPHKPLLTKSKSVLGGNVPYKDTSSAPSLGEVLKDKEGMVNKGITKIAHLMGVDIPRLAENTIPWALYHTGLNPNLNPPSFEETLPGAFLNAQLSPLQEAEKIRKEKGLGIVEAWADPEILGHSGLALIPGWGPIASQFSTEMKEGKYEEASYTAIALGLMGGAGSIIGDLKAKGLVKDIKIEPSKTEPITTFDDSTKTIYVNPTELEKGAREGRNPVAMIDEALRHEPGHALVDEPSSLKVGDKVTVKGIKALEGQSLEIVDIKDTKVKVRTKGGDIYVSKKYVEKASKTLLKDSAKKTLAPKKAKAATEAIDKGKEMATESEEKIVEDVTKTGDAAKDSRSSPTIPRTPEEDAESAARAARGGESRPIVTPEPEPILQYPPDPATPEVQASRSISKAVAEGKAAKAKGKPKLVKAPKPTGSPDLAIEVEQFKQNPQDTKPEPVALSTGKYKLRSDYFVSRAEFNTFEEAQAAADSIWNATHPTEGGGTGAGAMKAGALANNPDPEIEQLRQDIETRAKAGNIPKKDFTLGEKAERRLRDLKDNVKSTLGNLKSWTEEAWHNYKNLEPITDFTNAVDRWQGDIQLNLLHSKNFIKSVKDLMPSHLRREAMSRYLDAGGDKTILQQGATTSPDKFSRKAYETALNLTPDEIDIANNIQSYYDAMMQKGHDEGIFWGEVQSYINRVYDSKHAKLINSKIESDIQMGKLPTKFVHAKKRFYQYLLDAELAGMKPKTTDVADLVTIYNTEFGNTLAAREFVKNAHNALAPDGRRVIEISGGGGIIGTSTGPDKVLIKPHSKVRPKLIGGEPGQKVDISDYRSYDQPAFRKFKYVTNAPDGTPIMVEGDALIHPDYYDEFAKRFDQSVFERYKLLKGAKVTKAQVKAPKMAGSLFHQAHVDQHALTHRVWNPYKGAMTPLDLKDPMVNKAIYSGVKLVDSRGLSAFAEGVSGGEWIFKIPGAGPKLRAYTEWLFEDHIPKLKVMYFEQALKRNLKAYAKDIASGKITEQQLERFTAAEANASFGELNMEQMGRSKTAQDITSFVLLAPDFSEARLKYMVQALSPYGREQRIALMGGAAAMYVTARILNGVFNKGDMNLKDPKHAFEVKIGNKYVGIRSVQEDVIRIVTSPGQSLINRLNPVIIGGAMLATGRDRYGKEIHPATKLGLIKETAAETLEPMAINPDLERTVLQVLGFSVSKYTDPKLEGMFKDLDEKAEQIHKEHPEITFDRARRLLLNRK